jgi:uncharacterized membrane protein YbhN (UPF0104 family)
MGSADLVVQNPALVWTWPLSAILGAALAAVLITVLLYQWRRHRTPTAATEHAPSTPPGRIGQYLTVIVTTARDAWRAGATLQPRHLLTALGYATVNWLTDLLCLAASTHALGLPISITTLAGIYLGVQIVRQIPITPGGVGLIETAFLTGFTAAGAGAASAAAAILIYRLLSCWLVIPTGGLAALVLRRAHPGEPAATVSSVTSGPTQRSAKSS